MGVKEKLVSAIKILTIQKSIDAISVTDICRKADISRQAFYKCFKDKYDLVFWIYRKEADKLCDEYVEDHDYHKFLVKMLNIFKNDSEYYKNLLSTIETQNSFFHQYVTYSVDVSLEMIGKSNVKPLKKRVLRLFCYGVAMEIKNWVLGGATEDCDSFVKVIEGALPFMLREDYYYKEI